jgi:hypothetical protein
MFGFREQPKSDWAVVCVGWVQEHDFANEYSEIKFFAGGRELKERNKAHKQTTSQGHR